MAKVKQIRILYLFILLNLFTFSAYAQFDDDDRVFHAGLVAGMNYTQVDGDNFAGYHKAVWNVGVLVYARTGERTAASMELLLSQKGSRAAGTQVPRLANDQNTVLTDYRINLNYLDVPLLFNFFDKRRNNFGAGISANFLTGSKELYRNETGAVFENDAKLFPFKKYDLMYVLNGNAKIYKKLFLNIRFNYSLLSIRSQYNFVTGRPQQFNNVWTTRLMYLF